MKNTLFARVARGEIKSSGFDLNGGWSPWYTVHKLMSGLVDAYLCCDNQKALTLVVRMADWIDQTLKNLTNEQRLQMLNCGWVFNCAIVYILLSRFDLAWNGIIISISNTFFFKI